MQRDAYINRTQRAGIFLIHFYALSVWLNPIMNHLAFIGLFCLALFDKTTRDWLFHHRAALYALGFALIILALSLRGMLEYTEQLPRQLLSTAKWTLLSGFVFLLPWMAHPKVKPANLFGLALVGLIIGMLLHTAPGKILRFNIGSDHTNWQPHFQFSTAGMAGLSGGVCLAGLVLYRDRFFEKATEHRWIRGLLWLLGLYLTGYMILASQSRISWLALLITVPVGLLIRQKHTKSRERRKGTAIPNLLVLGVAVALAFGAWKNSPLFQERMTRDIEVFASKRSASFEGSSFGLRLKMMEFGLRSISQHPLLGWGNRGTATIAKETADPRFRSPEPDGRLIWFPHLHNTYLEILLRYGLIGLLMTSSVLWVSLLHLKRSLASHPPDPEAITDLVFTGVGLSFFAICGLAGFQIMQEEWRAPFSLLLALSLSGSMGFKGQSLSAPSERVS